MCFLYLYIYLIAASEFWSSSTKVERWDWLHNIWCCSKWWKHSADFLLMIAVIVCFTSLTKEEKDQASCKGISPYSWNDFLLVVCVFLPSLTFFFFFHWVCFWSIKKALKKSFLICSSLYFFSDINSIYDTFVLVVFFLSAIWYDKLWHYDAVKNKLKRKSII